jgi:Domain of unknown function (DUF1707)
MARPGDEMAAAARRGHFRASRVDRERAIEVLKAAFVQGRLSKDEFDLRVGQTLASRTYAELAAVTADIPAGLIGYQPPRTVARAQARPPMNNAAKACICVIIAVATMAVAVFVAGGFALMVFVPFYATALLAGGAQVLASRHEKRSRGQLPPRPGSSRGGSRRAASAEAEQPRQINQAQRHTAEAARSRLPLPAIVWLAATASMAPLGATLCHRLRRLLTRHPRPGIWAGMRKTGEGKDTMIRGRPGLDHCAIRAVDY